MKVLSKSNYMAGAQCPKYLWTLFNAPSRIPDEGASRQFVFEQGQEVGEVAKKLFPDGVDIPTDDFEENLRLTKTALDKRRAIFEAGFLSDDLFARVDILCPSSGNGWELVEVKSSTAVKDEHVQDVAFQKYVCERAGIKIERCLLMHINNAYVRRGAIDPESFFTKENITAQVNAQYADVPHRINTILGLARRPDEPRIGIGPYCNQPHECPLKAVCWAGVPENSVFDLYRGGQKAFDLFAEGISTIRDIPDTCALTANQLVQKRALTEEAAQVNAPAIKAFFDQLQWPLYFLDFETISPAIPLFDGTRPFQKVPFQFSLHVMTRERGETRHQFFLAKGAADPRPAFLKALKGMIGKSGSVVVYNQTFEQNVLKELAADFPLECGWIENVVERLVDLLIPFRAFDFYHPNQKGSASIKVVLPVLTGTSYDTMAISEGEMASRGNNRGHP